jgi:hypothetical protein
LAGLQAGRPGREYVQTSGTAARMTRARMTRRSLVKTAPKRRKFTITAVFALFSIIGLSLIKSQRRRFSHDFSTQPDS